MHITHDGFVDACRALSQAWQQCTATATRESGWLSLEIKNDSFDRPFLRITKGLEAHAASSSSSNNVYGERELTEHDPEVLRRNPPQASSVCYDLVYSPSYQVPVVYLALQQIERPTLDDVYSVLVPDVHSRQLRDEGNATLFGGLSLTDHPITNMPAYFVHPCRTVEAMGNFDGEGPASNVVWLLRFVGLIGSPVGLTVPICVAQRLGVDGHGRRNSPRCN